MNSISKNLIKTNFDIKSYSSVSAHEEQRKLFQ